jgi:cardiolipin synthase
VLWATTSMQDFRPTWLGKANTVAEILCIPFALLYQFEPLLWVKYGRRITLEATFALTILSGVHYVWLIGQRLHTQHTGKSAAA